MTNQKIGTQEEWKAEREKLLAEEKELTRRSDELAQEAAGASLGAGGGLPLRDDRRHQVPGRLFDGHSQLLIYHFMFGPPYEAGCTVCSSIADTLDPQAVHLAART